MLLAVRQVKSASPIKTERNLEKVYTYVRADFTCLTARGVKEKELQYTLAKGFVLSEKQGSFSDIIERLKNVQSIDKRLRSRIYGSGRGSVFTPDRFLDLGSRAAIDKALSRLAAEGVLQRLDRGLYHFPKHHPQLGTLAPAVEAIAKALAGKQAGRLQPAGAYAANLLGLSTQVPAKVVYYTELPSKRVRVGKQTIELKQTTPKNMATAGRISGMVIQAFKHLGKEHIDQSRIEVLKRRLPSGDKKQLLRDLPLAPGWMHALFRQIASD